MSVIKMDCDSDPEGKEQRLADFKGQSWSQLHEPRYPLPSLPDTDNKFSSSRRMVERGRDGEWVESKDSETHDSNIVGYLFVNNEDENVGTAGWSTRAKDRLRKELYFEQPQRLSAAGITRIPTEYIEGFRLTVDLGYLREKLGPPRYVRCGQMSVEME